MLEDAGCIHLSKNQSGCTPGQKQYICMSWVRPCI
jgi:hypothetical protein